MTLVHSERAANDVVIMIDFNGRLQNYQTVGQNLFSSFHYINMSAGSNKIIARQLRLPTTNKRKLDAIISQTPSGLISNIYVFNDAIPAGQYFIRKTKGKAVYVEDGSAPYNDHFFTWSRANRFKYWVAYGSKYHFVNVLGTSPLISESLFLNPTLVRKENTKNPFREFLVNPNFTSIIRDLAHELSSINDPLTKDVKRAALILLPSLMAMPPAYTKKIWFIIENLIENGWGIYLKQHPLDGTILEDIKPNMSCTVLSNTMPAEMLPVVFQRIEVVIGRETTSLLSIKHLFPNLQVINLIDDNAEPSQYQIAMTRAGVTMKNIGDLQITSI